MLRRDRSKRPFRRFIGDYADCLEDFVDNMTVSPVGNDAVLLFCVSTVEAA
jgi:hypothetical protein